MKKRKGPQATPDSQDLPAESDHQHLDAEQQIAALKRENAQVVKKSIATESKLVTAKHEIAFLKKELSEFRKPYELTPDELTASMVPHFMESVRGAGGWVKFCQLHGIDPLNID